MIYSNTTTIFAHEFSCYNTHIHTYAHERERERERQHPSTESSLWYSGKITNYFRNW
jgi:hypothetical protein